MTDDVFFSGGLQHRFTRTGGARPYGVSCLLVGFDENACPRVFRSEPSGAYAEWVASAVGKAWDKVQPSRRGDVLCFFRI